MLGHLKKYDPKLWEVAKKLGRIKPCTVCNADDYFAKLCEAIVGQQLSGKAAATIWERFVALVSKKKVTPENALKVDVEKLRKAGMSYSKAKYIRDLAERVKNKELKIKELCELSDTEIVAELTKVKGIGPWTAEMFLIFTLGRPDVFSSGDLGLRKAIKRIYGLQNPTRQEIEKICQKWSPYRSYACRILWSSLESLP